VIVTGNMFGDPDGFTRRLEQLVDEVFFPGELEARAARQHLEQGLSLPQQTLDDLRELAGSAGVPAP
jgi:LDH2 family malate/lactate/ureidoglycolate dehydrogenase